MPKTIEYAHEGDVSPPLRRLGQSVLLSADEIDFFESMQNNRVSYAKQEVMIAEGNEFRSLSTVEVALIEPIRLLEIHQRFPVLAAGLDWSAVRSSNILSEHNISLGARTAQERILHFYLELWCRLMLVGEASSDGFTMKMTQEQVANALGLSVVHVNKTLKTLTKQGLLSIKGRVVEVPDVKAAVRMADFDAAFLDSFRLANTASNRRGGTRDLMDALNELTTEMAESHQAHSGAA